MITCKNCNNQFEGQFCNQCGQSADTQRLDFKFLLKNLHKNFLKYFHKGIFYTSRQLFTRPGHSIREYIEGKRVNHFEPIGLLIAFAAFYGVLYHTFGINMFSGLSDNTLDGKLDLRSAGNWIADHFAIVTLLFVPVYSIGSFITFRKQGYNFYEHIYYKYFFSQPETADQDCDLSPACYFRWNRKDLHFQRPAYPGRYSTNGLELHTIL